MKYVIENRPLVPTVDVHNTLRSQHPGCDHTIVLSSIIRGSDEPDPVEHDYSFLDEWDDQ